MDCGAVKALFQKSGTMSLRDEWKYLQVNPEFRYRPVLEQSELRQLRLKPLYGDIHSNSAFYLAWESSGFRLAFRGKKSF